MEQAISDRVFNFSAGPSALPLPVLEKAQNELLSFQKCGMSVMEISHRSKEFLGVIEGAEARIRKIFGVSDDYAVLFIQGGASLQFAMAPMNLYIKGKPIDVINTGSWTKKALTEIKKLAEHNVAASGESDNFTRLPKLDEIKLNTNASYVHLASNNTIFGTQWKKFPETGDVPIVADMSSDIMSRKLDISKFGLIFAGAQKNLGPSGLALVIIRKNLAERADEKLPTMLQYRTFIKNQSLYNTPPTFGIYMLGLVMEWIENEGGLEVIEKRNIEKAGLLYDAIDTSSFYYSPINKDDRSDMNVVFRIKGDKEDLEKKMAQEAEKAGLTNLKGHRSIGGLRASIYNAQTLDGVKALIQFMQDFSKANS